MATHKKPWAILLCKFADDASEPPNAPGVPPFVEACQNLFTRRDERFNMVRYFTDMSHGLIDVGDSRVFGWLTLDANASVPQTTLIEIARKAARDAGVQLAQYAGVVVIMNTPTGAAQGSPGWVNADWRRVDGRNFDGTLGPRAPGALNGPEVFGQEMGHGFGLGHSRREGSLADYQDPWDGMSTATAFSTADPEFCARGPGLNAWNMRSRGWLDEQRAFHCPEGAFDRTIQLRPLHRHDLVTGFLAAEFPPLNHVGGFPRFLVEYRKKERWDAGIPRSCVLVHRYEGSIGGNDAALNHSYIVPMANGEYDATPGGLFFVRAPGGSTGRIHVTSIHDAQDSAEVRLVYGPLARRPWVACSIDGAGAVHVCATDPADGLWHALQRAGRWPLVFGDVQAETRRLGPNPGIGRTPLASCAAAPNGDLHVCAIDLQHGLWHTLRRSDGSWPFAFGDVQAQTRLVGPNPGIGPTPFATCAVAPSGDLHICALDRQSRLWHTLRRSDGSWPFAFGEVQAQTRLVGPNSGVGPTPFVACAAAPSGDLHICALDKQNRLWHTLRRADGSWPFAFADVQAQVRLVGPNQGIGATPFVACAAAPNGDLHVCVLDEDGKLWHTLRRSDGTWPLAFGDVQAQTRLIGPNDGIGAILRVACAVDTNGDLHVLAVDRAQGLWKSLRRGDGTWPLAFQPVE